MDFKYLHIYMHRLEKLGLLKNIFVLFRNIEIFEKLLIIYIIDSVHRNKSRYFLYTKLTNESPPIWPN